MTGAPPEAGFTAYDAVPYPSTSFPQTHPDALAVLAHLMDTPYAPMGACRVLEIGCGRGTNLIAQAVTLPRSRFVGFDLSGESIAAARARVQALGLANIELLQLDIMDAPEAGLGQFDYVIAHGVYAWVPPRVQEGIMRLIGACLAPEGLAFVSYNALPGSRLRQVARDLLLYHLVDIHDLRDRMAQAQSLLRFYSELKSPEEPFQKAISDQFEWMARRPQEVIFHDELGQSYEPVYFYQFLERAKQHGLKFFSETDLSELRDLFGRHSELIKIEELTRGDVEAYQQYKDFYTGRAFHQTLLCKRERILERRIDSERVTTLYVAGPVRCDSETPDLDSEASEQFTGSRESKFETGNPSLKRALMRLGEAWPGRLPFAALGTTAQSHVNVLHMFAQGFLDLHTEPEPWASEAGPRPRASPLARLQLAEGEPRVTTLRQHAVAIGDEVGRRFIALLDGTRAHDDLARDMAEILGAPPERVAPEIKPKLAALARLPLLLA